MNLFKKYKVPIIIVVILIVVFIIYSYMKGGTSQNNTVLTSTANPNEVSTVVGREFVSQLLTLKSVTLDTSVFNDPRFRALQDFSQPIPDQPQGRPNPFAPIGQDDYSGSSITPIGSNNLNFTFDNSVTSTSSKKK